MKSDETTRLTRLGQVAGKDEAALVVTGTDESRHSHGRES